MALFGFLDRIRRPEGREEGGLFGFLDDLLDLDEKIVKGGSKAAKAGRDIAVGTAREIARTPETALRSFAEADNDPLRSSFLKGALGPNKPTGLKAAVLGDEPVQTYQERRRGMQEALQSGENIFGRQFSEGAAGPLSGLGIALLAGTDLVPGGGGAKGASRELAERLVKETTETGVKSLLKNELPDEIIERVAPALAKTKDPNVISNILRQASPSPQSIEGIRPALTQAATGTPAPTPAKQRVLEALSEVKDPLARQEAARTAERGRRIGQASRAAQGLEGTDAYRAKLGQLKGRLPAEQYDGLIGKGMNPAEAEAVYSELTKELEAMGGQWFDQNINVPKALRKVVFGEGGLPTQNDIRLLKEAFGDEFAEAVIRDTSKFQKAKDLFGEVITTPRALMASADFSAGLRQGLVAATRHPVRFAEAFKKQFKFFGDENAFNKAMQEITSHPNNELMRKAGLAIMDPHGVGPVAREEVFVSSLAERVPGLGALVKRSNRAYTGLLNTMRANIFNDLVYKAEGANIQLDPKLLRNLGEVVNTATGRGHLGKLEGAAKELSFALFAPRLMASRFQLFNPQYYMKLEPLARKEALQSLGSLGAFAVSVLGLAKTAGAGVEADPRNADFGKIRVGDTRFDILGGHQQLIRLSAQLASGEIISSTTGKKVTLGEGFGDPTRLDILGRFFQQKESPVLSLASALLQGQDIHGRPINIPAEIASRFIPLVAQDIYDMAVHKNAAPLPSGAVALFGVGAQTYGEEDLPVTDKQEKYLEALKTAGASEEVQTAHRSFFQKLKTGPDREDASKRINEAIGRNDLDEAKRIADEYNKKLVESIIPWVKKNAEYATDDLNQVLQSQAINLDNANIRQRKRNMEELL